MNQKEQRVKINRTIDTMINTLLNLKEQINLLPQKKEVWLDAQDVMNLLHISQRKLQNLRSSKRLPFTRLGGKILYKESDIMKILSDNYNTKSKD
ncbi:helix-turn-helix domain-containing protein [Halosquirtibacter laminarini]|uniref:Helix-turn-helix domain-containing protein n=2 Tax=Halosquirtibacter laminarini TaxID=3374600 RepID=A0AC61NHE0_9BACT|nr:helix-turn-helix domain-containing protein [Prolixibacteraceae bacterium]QZE15071.1 helix-turn-helix domain-containing protein [Prolixibacteraceae bacterium]